MHFANIRFSSYIHLKMVNKRLVVMSKMLVFAVKTQLRAVMPTGETFCFTLSLSHTRTHTHSLSHFYSFSTSSGIFLGYS